jgi:hypothetical protein
MSFKSGCVLNASSAKPIKKAIEAAIKKPTTCHFTIEKLGVTKTKKTNENKNVK